MSSGLPLDQLARDISARLDKSQNYVVGAVMALKEAMQRVEVGEAGAITFEEWCRANIQTKCGKYHSIKEIRRLISYATSDNPEAAIEKRRAQVRAAKRRHDLKQRGLRNPQAVYPVTRDAVTEMTAPWLRQTGAVDPKPNYPAVPEDADIAAPPAKTVTPFTTDGAIVDKAADLLIHNLPRAELQRLITALLPAFAAAVAEVLAVGSQHPQEPTHIEEIGATEAGAEPVQQHPVEPETATMTDQASEPELDSGATDHVEPEPAPAAPAPKRPAPERPRGLSDDQMRLRENAVAARRKSLIETRGMSPDEAETAANAFVDQRYPKLKLPEQVEDVEAEAA